MDLQNRAWAPALKQALKNSSGNELLCSVRFGKESSDNLESVYNLEKGASHIHDRTGKQQNIFCRPVLDLAAYV